jgi:hypothetical protein
MFPLEDFQQAFDLKREYRGLKSLLKINPEPDAGSRN